MIKIEKIQKVKHFKEMLDRVKGLATGYDPEQLYDRMVIQMRNGVFKVVGTINTEETLDAFVMYEITMPFGKPELFVWMTWISPKHPEMSKEYMDYIENRAKYYRCSKITMSASDREKAWQRKYGFEVESVIMIKNVELPKIIEQPRQLFVAEKGV